MAVRRRRVQDQGHLHGQQAAQEAEDERLSAAIAGFWSRQGGAGTLVLSSLGTGTEGRRARSRTANGGGPEGLGSELGLGPLSEREEEGYYKLANDVMARLREVVVDRLEGDRWLFEPTDVMEALSVATHGRV